MIRVFTSFLSNIILKMLQLLSSKKHIISNLLSVYIKATGGLTLCIDIDPKYNIKQIKKIVAPKMGLQPEELKVIFAGKELDDTVTIEECDLGQQSVLHVVKVRPRQMIESLFDENKDSMSTSKPLCETLSDTMFSNTDDAKNTKENAKATSKVHFYVYCSTCKALKQGKLRARCNFCKSGAFTVHSDPQNWIHVLEPKQITGTCENDPSLCQNVLNNSEPTFAEFYFKCSEHVSLGENDRAVPLDLIRPNLRQVPCLACLEVPDMVLVFPCLALGHALCLDCFKQYCMSKLTERQFWPHPEYGYTLPCPSGCANSFIKEIHHFRLLEDDQYERYHRFGAEEFVLHSGGLLCPQPGCGMGILADSDCQRITCNSCKYVFCRNCLQGFHIGECDPIESDLDGGNCSDNKLDCNGKSSNRDEASRVTIKVITKPCPSCKTPTERDGGCMHMVCTRAGCKYDWCWVCQTQWTRECMGDHWFG